MGIKGDTYNAMDIYVPEDMFLRKDVSTEESLKIGGLQLRFRQGPIYKEVLTVSQVGLYQITGSKLEWANKLCESLEEEREILQPIPLPVLKELYYQNREWVNDDGLLVSRAIDIVSKAHYTLNDSMFLISGDKGVARRIADATGINVIMVNPDDLAREGKILPNEYGESLSLNKLINLTRFKETDRIRKPNFFLVDTGSERSNLSHMEWKGRSAVYRKCRSCGYDKYGHRVERITFYKGPDNHGKVGTICIHPTNAQKTKKIYAASEAFPVRDTSVPSRETGDDESLYRYLSER
jgi:hypothetical protein